jgi:hypothetical protein
MKGFHPWVQKVRVDDGKAVAFDKILLIPDTREPKSLDERFFTDLLPLSGTGYLLLAQGEQLKDHYVYDTKKDSIQPFLAADNGLEDFRVTALFAQDESPSLLLQGGPVWERKYLHAKLAPQGAQVRDISKLIADRPLAFAWDPASHDTVFALHEGYVDRLDIASVALYPRYIEDIRGWGIWHDQILVIDKDDRVMASYVGKKDLKPVFDSRELSEIFAREKDFYDIKPLTGESVLFIGSRSAIIFSRGRSCFMPGALTGFRHDPGHEKLLVWTRKAVGIIDLSDEARGDLTHAMALKPVWVFDQGRDIRQCFWAYDGSHIVFRDNNNIFLLALQPQGPARFDLVAVNRENTSVMYAEDRDVLYYLGARDGKIYALDILPRKGPGWTSFMEAPSSRKAGP